jgi:outer membrane biosynthesis protein TonB
VRLAVDAHGNVREPYIFISGGKLIDKAALDAIRQWKFRPFTLDGHATSESIKAVFTDRHW